MAPVRVVLLSDRPGIEAAKFDPRSVPLDELGCVNAEDHLRLAAVLSGPKQSGEPVPGRPEEHPGVDGFVHKVRAPPPGQGRGTPKSWATKFTGVPEPRVLVSLSTDSG